MEKLKALRNKSRGFCEAKKKHDSPTAIKLFGRENHTSFLNQLYIILTKKQIEASHLLPQNNLFQGELENLYSLI